MMSQVQIDVYQKIGKRQMRQDDVRNKKAGSQEPALQEDNQQRIRDRDPR
ncbi:hypothetical protein GN109_09945 [Collimonas pratensis]|nr:hypothetical protein [Collimonas pratensis]NKI69740.1 hypothetical protein [Collimonas pratensis]